MSKIYRRTDKIKLKIDDIILTISPLGILDKTEIQSKMHQGTTQNDIRLVQQAIISLLKVGVKNVEGLKNPDGSKYKLSFDDNGQVSDESIDDLFNISQHDKIVRVCTNLLGSIPDQFTDHQGNKLEGVEFVKDKKEKPVPNV